MTTTTIVTAGTSREFEQQVGRLPDDHPQRPVAVVLEDTLDELFGLTADLHRRLMQVRQQCDSIGLDLAIGRTLADWVDVYAGWGDVEFLRARREATLTTVQRLVWALHGTPGPIRVNIDSILRDVADRADVR